MQPARGGRAHSKGRVFGGESSICFFVKDWNSDLGIAGPFPKVHWELATGSYHSMGDGVFCVFFFCLVCEGAGSSFSIEMESQRKMSGKGKKEDGQAGNIVGL